MAESNVIIVHGAYGHPEENWFGWLRRELKQRNIDCLVPALPTPDGQSLQSWMTQFNNIAVNYIHSNTILVGHSLGAVFVLRWLETANIQINAALLAGTFTGKVGVDKFDIINASFFTKVFNWKRIKQHCQHFYCYHGDDDPYVPSDNFDTVSSELSAKKIVISRGGHLNVAAGFDRFPLILQHIKEHIQDA